MAYRNKQLNIRLSQEESDHLLHLCDSVGLNQTTLIRLLIRRYAELGNPYSIMRTNGARKHL